MCTRNDVDKKNIEITKQILKKYPKILENYINSLEDKTSYTKMVYARYIGRFLDYTRDEIKININKTVNYTKIKPMDISDYMGIIKYNEDGNENSASYRNVNLAAIKGFFDFLEDNDIIDKNPAKKIKAPKDDKIHDIVTITNEDYLIMLNNIKNGVGNHKARATQRKWINRDLALLILGLTTGLRISAIVGINLEDIDFERKVVITTEKGNKEREVFLGDQTIKILNVWIKERAKMVDNNEHALFICKGNKRMSTRAVQNRFKEIAEGTGKNITPHKMRATCATRLYEQTGDIYLVQNQLGHKSIESTKHYAKVSDAKLRAAANILNESF